MSRVFMRSCETTAGILFGAVMATLAVVLFLLALALGLLSLVVVVVWFLGSLAIEALLDCIRRWRHKRWMRAWGNGLPFNLVRKPPQAPGEDIKWPRR